MARKGQVREQNNRGPDKWSEPLPPPVVVDGFWLLEEGNQLEGVVMSRGESRYGPYYAIKVRGEVRASQGGEYVDLPAGSIVGVSEKAALRGLEDIISKGPTAVKILVKGKIGKAWDLEVRHRPAF